MWICEFDFAFSRCRNYKPKINVFFFLQEPSDIFSTFTTVFSKPYTRIKKILRQTTIITSTFTENVNCGNLKRYLRHETAPTQYQLPVAFVPRSKVAVIVSATIAHLVAIIVVPTTVIVITASIIIAIVVVTVTIIRSHVVPVVDAILSYCSK